MSLLYHISQNPLIAEVLKNNNFTESNLNELDYVKEWDGIYTFKNVMISNYLFKNIHIRITSNGTFINLFTDTNIFYDEAIFFFGTNGITHEKEPYLDDNREIPEYRRKLGSFKILDRVANVSVLKSEAYGCMIKMSFIS